MGVAISSWESEAAQEEWVIPIPEVADYEPGQFYKRELPCLLTLLEAVPHKIEVIVVDGYVWLGPDRKGLGAHLHAQLGGETAVIGVAKSHFHEAPGISVLRGDSKNPLFVTAEGIPLETAAEHVRAMAGEFRLPTLLKYTDRLTKD